MDTFDGQICHYHYCGGFYAHIGIWSGYFPGDWKKCYKMFFFLVLVSGCLLRSLPSDLVFDNSSGFSFICDLTDNIAAPWPTSSSMQSLSLCAPEMSLPALPSSETAKNPGSRRVGIERFVPFFSFFVLSALLLY
ncbi:hypothetical protein SAY87_004727 [Trapa incisa]|uniref:Uncharacterized protein n=1 Tax=Trapa incisa TaxID=236973 RepID=A0AAN7JPA6_9MYRT|nr:hypothetical protein SAY87_004727 [Trapa incisa]